MTNYFNFCKFLKKRIIKKILKNNNPHMKSNKKSMHSNKK